jgi:hypothetical protein
MAFPFAAKIAAQSGPQTEFLRSGADICIYGGAAGGGKTAGLILEPLRHVGRVAKLPPWAAANKEPETMALASATPRSRSSRHRLRNVFGEHWTILAISS